MKEHTRIRARKRRNRAWWVQSQGCSGICYIIPASSVTSWLSACAGWVYAELGLSERFDTHGTYAVKALHTVPTWPRQAMSQPAAVWDGWTAPTGMYRHWGA